MTIRVPEQKQLEQFFSSSLLATAKFQKDSIDALIKLDQNEAFADWPEEVKREVLAKVARRQWNRYPEPYCEDLKVSIARHIGVKAGNVVVGPGSNYLLTVLINAFCRNTSQNVVARPSFPLYEAHLKYEAIKYETWDLNEELEYDLKLLPKLQSGSLVLFASPNNPVGNSLELSVLGDLLAKNPHTLFVADEAYLEFGGESCAPLLKDFSNLIIVRTFSKTMGAAALRLGFLLGHQAWLDHIEKLILPFLINPFTESAVLTILQTPSFVQKMLDSVSVVIEQRESLLPKLQEHGRRSGFNVKPTKANFFLIRCKSQTICDRLYQHFLSNKILVRNVSRGPSLAGCMRLSIGHPTENDQVLACLKSFA